MTLLSRTGEMSLMENQFFGTFSHFIEFKKKNVEMLHTLDSLPPQVSILGNFTSLLAPSFWNTTHMKSEVLDEYSIGISTLWYLRTRI